MNANAALARIHRKSHSSKHAIDTDMATATRNRTKASTSARFAKRDACIDNNQSVASVDKSPIGPISSRYVLSIHCGRIQQLMGIPLCRPKARLKRSSRDKISSRFSSCNQTSIMTTRLLLDRQQIALPCMLVILDNGK